MMRRFALVGWLVVVWVALWQDLSVANVVSGVVVAAGLVLLFPLASGRARVPVRPWAVLRFAAVFAARLVQANAIVAWQVLRPASTVVEGIVAVPLRTTSNGIATIVADAVTLTPGTMTIDIRSPFWQVPNALWSVRDLPERMGGERVGEGIVLYVHVLQLGDPDDIRADVHRFEDLAIAAFGDHPSDGTEETSP